MYGVHDYPALVYFEGGIPNVFEGEYILTLKKIEFIENRIEKLNYDTPRYGNK